MTSALTYDWNGHKDMPISYPHLSDAEMAGKVRMLFRDDLDHEGVVMGARDRIMALSKEVARLTEERDRIERNRDMYRGQVERQSATITQMREALSEAEDYFDNLADADCDQDGYIPNEEMKLLQVVREALRKAGA